MTKEEAINILYGMRADNLNFDDFYVKDKYDALEMAIKALKEKDILDKVRAEIEAEPYISKMEVLDIIDKYKAESEVEE